MAAKRRYTDRINIRGNSVDVDITGIIFQEEGCWVSFSPAFDASSYGDTPQEAAQGLQETVQIIVSDLKESGRLEEDLQRLGWRVGGSGLKVYSRRQTESSQLPPGARDDYFLRPMAMAL